jgi:endonuclease/exonuclease/phosphatase family metal-dependent hydrolase
MRIAVFNVENLFDRARIMNLADWQEGRPVLEAFEELTDLLEAADYEPHRDRIAALMLTLGLRDSDTGPFVILRRNRGSLVRRRDDGTLEITAAGRADWIGWLELRTAPVNATAIRMTARVIAELRADIMGVVEAEDRIALKDFARDLVPAEGGTAFPNVMVIDGNDSRGIDVGLMTAEGYGIGRMRSHVHEGGPGDEVFGRDCPEYEITTPAGETLWVLLNHLKSKGYGGIEASARRRRRQAEHVAGYYRRLRAEGVENVVVMGDLNDTPGAWPLRPLLEDTDLRDIAEFPGFDTGEFAGRGTYGLGNDGDKIDYILLSPALYARIRAAGIFRRGAWPGSRPKRWTAFPEIQRKVHAASDHHALWVEIAD